MRSILKGRILLLAAFPLILFLSMPVRAIGQDNQAHPAAGQPTSAEHMDEPESHTQIEGFRHSPAVGNLSHILHLDIETTARIMEILNSGILLGAIFWFLFRVVPKAFRKRNDTLEKQLVEARLATTEANERLAVIEERLSKLGVEIEAIREQTERDMAEDEKRIQESLEAERQRIVASSEREIDAAGAAVKRDLKKFAAELAVSQARKKISLSQEDDRALIHAFGESLNGERN